MGDFFKVDEFADAGGFRPATVRAWILHRKITVVRLGGRAIRIPKSELDRLIREGTVPARDTAVPTVRETDKASPPQDRYGARASAHVGRLRS